MKLKGKITSLKAIHPGSNHPKVRVKFQATLPANAAGGHGHAKVTWITSSKESPLRIGQSVAITIEPEGE